MCIFPSWQDDITQLNEDEETSKSVPDLSCGPEFVQVKMDSKGQSDVVLDTVDDAAPGNVLTNKVSSPGSATFSDEGKGTTECCFQQILKFLNVNLYVVSETLIQAAYDSH